MSATDRVIGVAAGSTVAVLAGVAGAISYSHMAELARLHGEVGWRAHAFPVSVDSIEIVASLVLLAHRRARNRTGWLPWAALAAGTVASLAANVAVGASDPVGRLVAGWPAVALLLAVKLISGLLDAAPDSQKMRDPAGPGADPDGPGAPGIAGTDPGPCSDGPLVSGELVAAVGLVRDQLLAEGTPMTRRSLAAGLRAAGHRVRNDRLGQLMALLNGPDTAGAAPPTSMAGPLGSAGGRHDG